VMGGACSVGAPICYIFLRILSRRQYLSFWLLEGRINLSGVYCGVWIDWSEGVYRNLGGQFSFT
jgi:hypothetical protein